MLPPVTRGVPNAQPGDKGCVCITAPNGVLAITAIDISIKNDYSYD